MKRKNLFHYNSKILKVSQLAAIAVYDYIGKKDETSLDRAAVCSMREELNKLDFNGTITIGEGEIDKAPMLYIGEKVGTKKLELKIGTSEIEKKSPGPHKKQTLFLPLKKRCYIPGARICIKF